MPDEPMTSAALITREEIEVRAPLWLLQHALDEHLRFCRGCAESNPYLCRGRQYAEELRSRLKPASGRTSQEPPQ